MAGNAPGMLRTFRSRLEVLANAGRRVALSTGRRATKLSLMAPKGTLREIDGPHPVVASAAREVLNKSENERSGVSRPR